MLRRDLLSMMAVAAVGGVVLPAWLLAEAEKLEVMKTDEEWRRLLTPAQYQVLRHEDTESRTGWPSFWSSIDGAVGTKLDRSFLMERTEVHCRRCGGHLGHVFDDGPPPTGLRYCMNGVALKFIPEGS